MGDLVNRITQLLNFSKTIAVTVPGLIAAAAIVILHVPKPSKDFYYVRSTPESCAFAEKDLDDEPFDITSSSQVVIENRKKLEQSQAALQRCIIEITSEVGTNEGAIAAQKEEIDLRVRERGAFEKKYLAYVESRGVLTDEYRNGFNARNVRIQALRDEIVATQKTARTKQLDVDRLKAQLDVVKARLGDPTRVRSAGTVPDLFDSLTTRAAAFVLLAMVLGFALDPLNSAIFGSLFEWGGRSFFNRWRTNRYVYRIR